MRQFRSSIISVVAVCATLAASAVFGQEERQPAADQEVRREAGQQENQRPGQADQARRQPGQPGQARQQAGQGGQQAGGVNDQLLARMLIIENEGEVGLAEFAQERAQSEQVKQFAQRMVQDHRQMIQRLQQVAGQQGRQLGQTGQPQQEPNANAQPGRNAADEAQNERRQAQAERTQPGAAREAAERPGAEQRTTGFRPGEPASDLIQLKQQLAEQCGNTLREEFGRYQGADFDKVYMHHATMAHLKAADTLQVFQRSASPELRETLAQGLQTTQEHLQMARQLRQQLDQQGAGGQNPQGRQQPERPRRQQPSDQQQPDQPQAQPQRDRQQPADQPQERSQPQDRSQPNP